MDYTKELPPTPANTVIMHGEEGLQTLIEIVKSSWERGKLLTIQFTDAGGQVIFEPDP